MEEKIVEKGTTFDELMVIRKEILEENKHLRTQTFWLIALTLILIMEPVTTSILPVLMNVI